jgi:hypothetical protein
VSDILAPPAGGLAVDDASVYFSNNASVLQRVAKDGGGRTTLSTEPGSLYAIGVDDTSVYWSSAASNGSVRRADKVDGGSVVTLASNQSTPIISLALDSTHVYYTAKGLSQVMRVMKNASAGPEVIDGPVTGPTGIAVDDTWFFYTLIPGANPGAVMARRKDLSQSSTPLASGIGVPGDVVIDSVSVYYTAYADGTVKVVGKPGVGGGITIASGQNSPNGLAVDTSQVYWGSYAGQAVSRSPKASSSPSILANALSPVMAVAVDDCCVYWIARGNPPNSDGQLVKWVK